LLLELRRALPITKRSSTQAENKSLLQLETIPGLADRMGALMCVVGESEDAAEGVTEEVEDKAVKVDAVLEEAKAKVQETGGDVLWLELDDLDISDAELQSLNLSKNFPVRMMLTSSFLLCRTVVKNISAAVRFVVLGNVLCPLNMYLPRLGCRVCSMINVEIGDLY
jgi:hypothetical protein